MTVLPRTVVSLAVARSSRPSQLWLLCQWWLCCSVILLVHTVHVFWPQWLRASVLIYWIMSSVLSKIASRFSVWYSWMCVPHCPCLINSSCLSSSWCRRMGTDCLHKGPRLISLLKCFHRGGPNIYGVVGFPSPLGCNFQWNKFFVREVPVEAHILWQYAKSNV